MKNRDLKILFVLVVISLCFLGITIFEKIDIHKMEPQVFPLKAYQISIPNYNLLDIDFNEDVVYLLFNKGSNYIVKKIDTTTNKESVNTYVNEETCSLQNENNYPFIICKGKDDLTIYNMEFINLFRKNTSDKNYVIYKNSSFEVLIDNDDVLNALCFNNCYFLKYNKEENINSLYKNSELLEIYITSIKRYENGFATYNNLKLRIYNALSDQYKEVTSIIDLKDKLWTIGYNNSYLYVLDNSCVNVYSLTNGQLIFKIDITKVTGNVNKIEIRNGNLNLFTDDLLYVYDISEIEENTINASLSQTDVIIDTKLSYFEDNYGVLVNIYDNPQYLNTSYKILPANDYGVILEAIEKLENYFLIYNKDFFQRFCEYDMKGLEFYFASDIIGLENGYENTDIGGLYFKKDNKYIIVLNLNSVAALTGVAHHETMHAIEDYLKNKNEVFAKWNQYNPEDFNYSHVYYVDKYFNDTINNNKDNNEIYFVDNYARSSSVEDRARLFEYVCKGESFSEYPHINSKINYLKSVLLNYFPELYYVSYFNR